MAAIVHSINISKGGVPKDYTNSSFVGELGLTGDGHHHKKVHGGPERAVCLYSLERIEALRAEGHPVFPGSLGENLTIVGVDWNEVQPGRELGVGDELRLRVTNYAPPCLVIEDCFIDGKVGRVSQKKHAGWSRVYASVMQVGRIYVGDQFWLF